MSTDEKPPKRNYDTPIREIFQEGCPEFIGLLGVQGRFKRLDVKLPRSTAREVDALGQDTSTGVIHHIEFQARNDPFMHARMLVYAGQIGERILRQGAKRHPFVERRTRNAFPIIQATVVYIGRRPMQLPNEVDAGPDLRFKFKTVDARDLNGEALLESPHIGDAVLSVLCRDGAKPARVRRILERIAELVGAQRDGSYGRLLILSSLRAADHIVEKERIAMNLHIDLDRIASVRQHALHKQADLVLRQVGRKFGADAVTSELSERLTAMNEEALGSFAEKLVDARSIDELLGSSPAAAPKP